MQRQSYSKKLTNTKQKIVAFVEKIGVEDVTLMFSGGKDSTVLLHIVRQLYPDISVYFVNTGIEFPEVISFVKLFSNVNIVRTSYKQLDIYKEVGYPVASKEISKKIHDGRNSSNKKVLLDILGLGGSVTRLNKKYMHFLDKAFVPYKISNSCCYYFKKKVLSNKKNVFLGTRAEESNLREKTWMKYGCNHFGITKNSSSPLSLWLATDIEKYLKDNNIAISTIYTEKEALRTGCYNCRYGLSIEEQKIASNKLKKNRFEKLLEHHPKLYKYSMETIGMEQVLLDSGIKVRTDPKYMIKYYKRQKEIEAWYNNYDYNMERLFTSLLTRGVKFTKKEKAQILEKNRFTDKWLQKIVQLNKDGSIVAKYNTIKEASIATNVDYSNIGKACLGKLKSAGGFAWKYDTSS